MNCINHENTVNNEDLHFYGGFGFSFDLRSKLELVIGLGLRLLLTRFILDAFNKLFLFSLLFDILFSIDLNWGGVIEATFGFAAHFFCGNCIPYS